MPDETDTKLIQEARVRREVDNLANNITMRLAESIFAAEMSRALNHRDIYTKIATDAFDAAEVFAAELKKRRLKQLGVMEVLGPKLVPPYYEVEVYLPSSGCWCVIAGTRVATLAEGKRALKLERGRSLYAFRMLCLVSVDADYSRHAVVGNLKAWKAGKGK